MPVIQEIPQGSSVRSVLTLPEGKWANTPLRMFFLACQNAACGCADLIVSLFPESKDEPNPDAVIRFTVDVRNKKLTGIDEPDEAAKEAVRHFDDQDWSSLWQTFASHKLEYTEYIDTSLTHASFPTQAIEEQGELVPYNNILPYGRSFSIENSEGTILLDEQYCLRRGCDCDRVVVSFIPVKDSKQAGRAADLEVRYRSGKTSSLERGSLKQTPQAIFKDFLEQYPDLLQQFLKRHKQLTVLYNHYRKLKSEIKTLPKVGRNDLCPCGSGNKYKKCCLNLETQPTV